jgi:serine/threonine protein kinase
MYSFGVLAYELISGQPPYEASSESEWLDAHRNAEPRDLLALRAGVDRQLATLVRRCLSKEPKHRPAAADIVRALGERAQDADTPTYPVQRFVSSVFRRRMPQALVATSIVSWGLIEGISTLIQNTPLPPIAFSLALVFGLAAVAAAGVLSWYHGQPGIQKPPLREFVLLGMISTAWLVTSILLML